MYNFFKLKIIQDNVTYLKTLYVSLSTSNVVDLHFLTLFLILKRGWMQSDQIAIRQIRSTFLLPILPIFTFIMYLIPMDQKWQLIVTLIIDIGMLIAYAIITVIFAQLGDRASKDLNSHKSEFVAPVSESNYDNDDGTFKGSSWRNK